MYVIRYMENGVLREVRTANELTVCREDAGFAAESWSPTAEGDTLLSLKYRNGDMQYDRQGLVFLCITPAT